MSKGTVLVVDDDPSIVEFLTQALEDEEYRVVTSVDGASLPLARETQPDVILLDIMMPGMDGIEVSQRLRQDPGTADIPIVVMSARDRLRDTTRVMDVDGRLPKPFDLDFLYATVAHWMRSPRRSTRALTC
jgi:CheY-like chemotaxis protein